MDLGGGNR